MKYTGGTVQLGRLSRTVAKGFRGFVFGIHSFDEAMKCCKTHCEHCQFETQGR
jgi:hypothetical protein